MVSSNDDKEFQKQVQRIETLLSEMDGFTDPAARTRTQEIVQGLLNLHGKGLEKIMQHIADCGEAGAALMATLARDDLVASLLLLYGLHPDDLETRVRRALDQVRPYLRSQGSEIELLRIEGSAVRVRADGSSPSCSSSPLTLKRAIEEAIYEKAPDVAAIDIEGLEASPSARPAAFVPVEQLVIKKVS